MEFKNHEELVAASSKAAKKWRLVPAPQRGEFIRQFGNELEIRSPTLQKSLPKRQEKLLLRPKEKFKKLSICAILLLV